MVVEVLMLQVPSASVISITGVENVAAFLSSMPTSRAWYELFDKLLQGETDMNIYARYYLKELLVLISRGSREFTLEDIHCCSESEASGLQENILVRLVGQLSD